MAKPTALEVDYLIVGAGAMGMAFADTLVAESDAMVAVVDRYAQPGGHWTVAYPYVRLHQPSAFYGVNSRELGSGSLDQDGWNAGLHELASTNEILTYFHEVMHKTLLPTGRVSYHPMSFYDGPDPARPGIQRFHSVVTGAEFEVTVRRRTVDATYMNVTVPSMAPPKYKVAPGVRLITPNQLPALEQRPSHYTVVGAGKTGIDACLWLLNHDVGPSDITWIAPRDAWLLDRTHIQPGPEFAPIAAEANVARIQAVTGAGSFEELFQRLEAGGTLLRISPEVTPTSYRCATVTPAELAQLRRIDDVVRHGRIRHIDEETIELDHASVPVRPATLYIDCTADGLEQRPPVPVFDGARITLQSLISCQQVFSASLAAHVEAAYDDDSARNELCVPSPHPNTDVDWLRSIIDVGDRLLRWSADPGLRDWLGKSRLFLYATVMLAPEEQTETVTQLIHAEKGRLQELLAQVEPAAAAL